MKLSLLIDVGVGQKAEQWLKSTSHDVKTIRDIDPRMLDLNILKIAVSEKRLLITLDKDFGELVYKSNWPHAGVLLLRLEDESASEKIRVIDKILMEYSDKLVNNFSVFKDNKLRVRH